MRLSYILPLLGVVAFTFNACKKNEKTIVPPASAPPIDSVHPPVPVPITYPYTDRYSGVLTKNIDGITTDSPYIFYVTHQSEDTIIFISAGAIAEGSGLPHRRFRMKYRVSAYGVYPFDNYYIIALGDDPFYYFDPASFVLSRTYLKITWQDFFFEDFGKPIGTSGGIHTTTCICTYNGKLS